MLLTELKVLLVVFFVVYYILYSFTPVPNDLVKSKALNLCKLIPGTDLYLEHKLIRILLHWKLALWHGELSYDEAGLIEGCQCGPSSSSSDPALCEYIWESCRGWPGYLSL